MYCVVWGVCVGLKVVQIHAPNFPSITAVFLYYKTMKSEEKMLKSRLKCIKIVFFLTWFSFVVCFRSRLKITQADKSEAFNPTTNVVSHTACSDDHKCTFITKLMFVILLLNPSGLTQKEVRQSSLSYLSSNSTLMLRPQCKYSDVLNVNYSIFSKNGFYSSLITAHELKICFK